MIRPALIIIVLNIIDLASNVIHSLLGTIMIRASVCIFYSFLLANNCLWIFVPTKAQHNSLLIRVFNGDDYIISVISPFFLKKVLNYLKERKVLRKVFFLRFDELPLP